MPSTCCRFASVQGGDQLHADRRAVGNAEGDEQKAARRSDVRQFGEEAAGLLGDVRRTDFPGTAVEAGLEAQAPHHLARGFLGVGIADVQRLAGFFGHDGVDEVSGDAVAGTLRVQLGRHVLAFRDQREVVAEDAGMALDLAVRQVRLRDVQRQIAQRAAVVVGNGEQPLHGQAIVAADEGVFGMRHGIPPAEDGRGNSLPGIEPQRVDEVATGQPAAASGRPGGGRCRSVEDADSGHGRSCERKEGHGPERGCMSLVGWDERTVGCQARLTSRCSAA